MITNALLNLYFFLQRLIYSRFDYHEQWRVLPMDDCRAYYWQYSEDNQEVVFARTPNIQELIDNDGEWYSHGIWTYRHLDKWIYKTKSHTMFVVDTQTDGNKFLQIFDNKKEVKES